MMEALRVLDSKAYKTWLKSTGSNCGNMPNRTAATDEPPVDRTPSTGLSSAASMASENSLPKLPRSDMHSASTPAKGPRPTTLIQISAQIRMSTPRKVSKLRRAKNCTTPLIVVLRAARKPSGNAAMAAMSVPSSAMASVSSMP